MSKELDITIENAFKQARMTADDYLGSAIDILDKHKIPWKTSDAVELAKVMAMDFNTAIMATKLQEIRDAIGNIDVHS